MVNGNVNYFKDVPNAEKYLSLSESETANLLTSDYEYKNLTELSYTAFEEYERFNEENKKAAEAEETVMVEEDVNATYYSLYSPGQGADKWEKF